MSWNRRVLLKLLGAAAGGLYLPSGLRLARASTGGPPMRLIVLASSLGLEPRSWRMQPIGESEELLTRSLDSTNTEWRDAPESTGWEFSLVDRPREQWSFGLEPLYRFRDRLTVLDGLAYHTTALDSRTDDGHPGGVLHALTASPSVGGSKLEPHAGMQSFHHEIGDFLRSQDPTLTDLASIDALLTDTDHSWAYRSEYVYRRSGSGETVKPSVEQSPLKLHQLIFDGFVAPDVDAPPPPADPFADNQGQVLALLKDRYERARSKVGTADRSKIEQHRELIFDLERRLEAAARISESGECSVVTEPVKPIGTNVQMFDANLRDLTDILVASMSCGLVRTASITMAYPDVTRLNDAMFVDGFPTGPEPWKNRAPIPNENGHQFYSHGSIPRFEFTDKQSDRDRWSAAIAGHARAQRYWMTTVARLADALDAVPEAGGTMLDSTLIYVTNELAHGGHTSHGMGGFLIGGAGRHRKGRYIKYPHDIPKPWNTINDFQFTGQPHNKLITGICQDFGMTIDRFGASEVRGYVQRGVNEGMERTVNLTGVLPGLYP
ncbi:MAG: DUF1552 domain-containing protein [Myxococcota bacterium]